MVLTTPEISENVTFTILASRTYGPTQLETYLNQPVSIKMGIYNTLAVRFQPQSEQIRRSDGELIINYGQPSVIEMAASQEGILYELLDANGVGILEGKAQPGNQRPLVLTSTPLTEDTRIRIKAYRRQPLEETLLTTELSVKVRPNPNVGVRSSSDDPVDYGAATIISLDTPQLSTAYQLYKWQLTPKHYQPGGQVSIPTPSQLPNWENLERVGDFVESAGQQSCTTGPIHEDTFFIVRTTKIENGETLPLTTIVPVLAKPDTSPSVRAESPAVDANSSGRVIVTHTQAGVHYQLRVNDGDALVNQPGYPRL
ncbi:hypothetical protein C2W62_31255 [Candidatus Entotheonella serta]|nr:hypothetical protein C2W62_31255 [Candidatus Entotheonella serta]